MVSDIVNMVVHVMSVVVEIVVVVVIAVVKNSRSNSISAININGIDYFISYSSNFRSMSYSNDNNIV